MSSGPKLILDERARRREGILAQEAQGQTVLLRLEDGGYYALDEVGARIWELCDGHRAVSEIVTELCAEFDAPEAIVRADVIEFIGDLRREQLLVLDSS
ncbi:MAG: pyrroloquinoline quinone biosynthesis peptide chaperone PqqD [Solirubrobacteraceae bacterium]|jgi:coenzyme PQQ biosynthesis protein PqqD